MLIVLLPEAILVVVGGDRNAGQARVFALLAEKRAGAMPRGWLTPVGEPAGPGPRAALADPDDGVAAAADEAMARLRDAEHTWELLAALAAEKDRPRRWRLLDCLIGTADPGDGHGQPPEWARQVWLLIPPAMRDHLKAGLERRLKEQAREAERG